MTSIGAMELAEYSRLDGLALAGHVADQSVTPQELAALALAAADRVNETLGAVIETWPEPAQAAPAVGDGPFTGVPIMLKDLFHSAAGRTCENGSRLTAGLPSGGAEETLARLRRAGFIDVGRTTTSEFGILGSTQTLASGPTCTPWSADHIAGGSSGGSGAAVGAGIVPVATASDGGGSIRIPAACCGVVGLKPTRGRVTFGPGTGDPLSGWAVKFVITRSVRDAAATLDAIAGPLAGDPSVAPSPTVPFLEGIAAAAPLRIAFCHESWSGRAVHPEVAAACGATAELLSALGHEVEPAVPPFAWEPFLEAMTAIWSADTAYTIDGIAAFIGREPGRETLEGPTLAMLEHGRTISAQELLDAHAHVNVLSREMGAFFTGFDVLLTPTLGTLPWRLGVYDPHADLAPRELFDTWSELECFLPAFNATGQPAISLPLHQSTDGLPIGMQLVGRFGDEPTLLSLAAELEAALPWADRLPPIHAAQ